MNFLDPISYCKNVKALIQFIMMNTICLLCACATIERVETSVEPKSFEEYRNDTLTYMREARKFQLVDKESELQWNAPKQWTPESLGVNGKPERGILFVHGLGDSPWSFTDLGKQLAEQGFLVRTVLLPGHGTSPYDMLNVTAEEWIRIVYEQAKRLTEDVEGEVFLGGFSTGANIVLDYAYKHPEIAGLIFFSPGFKSMPFDWLAPLVSKVMPWIIEPGENIPMQTPIRYMNVPTNGYTQFYRTSVNARRLLEHKYDRPVFMAVAEHDSVLDTNYLLKTFQNRFVHPKSRLIWYGKEPENISAPNRILVRDDNLPEERISQFSHMGLLFSHENPLYGRNGTQRICLNGMNSESRLACENGAEVWFSAWGYEEKDKVHARLTYNPYFQWQTSVLLEVLNDK